MCRKRDKSPEEKVEARNKRRQGWALITKKKPLCVMYLGAGWWALKKAKEQKTFLTKGLSNGTSLF